MNHYSPSISFKSQHQLTSLKQFTPFNPNVIPKPVSFSSSRRFSTTLPRATNIPTNSQTNTTGQWPNISPQQFSQALSLLIDAVDQGTTRLQRTFTPPPPNFPPGPSGDVALTLLQDPLSFLTDVRQKYGPVVGLLLGGERVILVTDREAARQVLIDQPDVFIKTGTAFFPGSSLAGNGLLVSDGDVWRRQRQLATPAFRKTAIDMYAQAMVSSTKELVESVKWRAVPAVKDVYMDFNDLTLKIVLRALFGSAVSAAESKELTDSIRVAFEFFARRSATAFIIPEYVPTPDNLQFGAAVARLDKAVYSLISKRKSELAAHPRPPQDLLDSLLVSKDDSGLGMSDVSLRDELMTLLVAGQETSAILLGWSCAYLAQHPSIQDKLAQEAYTVIQGNGTSGVPTACDVRSGALQYTEAVVLETLRLMPPAYLVGRCACSDAELAGYTLPQGTTVLVSPYVMHRDGEVWDHVDDFLPERWLHPLTPPNNNQTEKIESATFVGKDTRPAAASALSGMGPNGAYFPFGAGQRNCIGTGFAMMEVMLVLALILNKFELGLVPGGKGPRPDPRITLRPESVRVVLRKRKWGPHERRQNKKVEEHVEERGNVHPVY